MAGSLRDQLLKAGLVTHKQVRQAEADKQREQFGAKGKRKAKAKRGQERVSLAQAYAQKAREEQQERDRELNRKREEARQRREIKARLKQLVPGNAQNDAKAEVARFFEWNGKIRKAYVTASQQTALNDGAIGIVHHGGRFYVVAAEVIAQVKELQSDAVAFFAPDVPDIVEGQHDDYAQFPVPDDLMW